MTAPIDISPEAVEKWASFYEQEATPEVGHMLRALRLQLTACEKRVQELEPAAECWAALAACARIKVMGAAGLHSESPDFASPRAHIGLEFWTHHEAKGDAQDINGRDWFGRFMNKCLAAYRATGAKP